MKYIELFAGIGGFRKGLEQASSQFECVYANDFDKYAAQIYKENFFGQGSGGFRQEENVSQGGGSTNSISQPDLGQYTSHFDTRDITTVPTEEIPDHDLLVGGFPCQAFSIAGKRRGFDDTRGTLFFEIARILKDKKPKYFILENVKGLLSHDSGNTFKTIIATLDELGYDLQWQVLNSKNFGVPQNRERVFIIGNLRGEPRPEVFPVGGDDNPLITKGGEQASNAVISRTLTATDAKMHLDGNYINVVGTLESGGWEKRHEQIRRVHGIDGISPTIPTGTGGGVMTKVAIPVSCVNKGEKVRQNGRRFKTHNEPQFTLNTIDQQGVYDGVKIRRLTPLECERLQGFEDGWTEGISDTQRYKCLGNAVTVNVVEYIASKLLSSLGDK